MVKSLIYETTSLGIHEKTFSTLMCEWHDQKKILDRISILLYGRNSLVTLSKFDHHLRYEIYDFTIPVNERSKPIIVLLHCDMISGEPSTTKVVLPSYMHQPEHRTKQAVQRILTAVIHADLLYSDQETTLHLFPLINCNKSLIEEIESRLINLKFNLT